MLSDKNTNLWAQDLWDKGYSSENFSLPPKNDQVRRWLEKYLSQSNGSCIEIGCFPGRYLAVCGNFGYELNGIDLTPRVDTDMPNWLKSQGYRVGRCERGDFFGLAEDQKFELVYSNGFIEHFTKWEDVLSKHARLVKPGGMLMISVPNFVGGFQSWFHRTLDRENYDRHFTPSMDPEKWIQVLGDSFEIIGCEYFSEFGFWIGEQKRTLIQKLAFWALRAMIPVLRLLPKNKRLYSPYCGLVARKRG